ncbi:MAG: hypothetical protein UR66_C0003G0103 [Candidatus Moranbacteria bacterium GW2011_GWE1_35_17]|nr:MAG: hypothetical protein UR66_C0003G0103 [Candidatus Moranbacteria bacterium GW2011_GWE1_35_17]KKP82074.1 MAG: hypothetical protein UR82_C0044G0006 [Candidatus Moranbacteria bacterium GW2011_GWF1_35_5]
MTKRGFWNKINIYFLFVALAFAGSAYLLLLDNFGGYVSNVNILVYPKNTKTAAYLSELKEGIVVVAQKSNTLDEGVALVSDPEDNLIEIQSHGNSRSESIKLSNSSILKLSNLFSKFYDVKNDIGLEIVSREIFQESYSKIIILIGSIVIGAVLSLVVQVGISLLENAISFFINIKISNKKESAQTEKYLGDFFKTNREKIQKLSSSFPLESQGSRIKPVKRSSESNVEKKDIYSPNIESQVYFKKAASPANLPIAEDDLNRIIQVEGEILNGEEILNDLGIFPETETSNFLNKQISDKGAISIQEASKIQADDLKDALKEPTEEDFKKRLNQLLGNK